MRLKYSKLTHIQTNKLLEHFVAGTPARTACLLAGVNKITATDFYHRLRVVIAKKLVEEVAELAGEIEVDESYFGGVRKGMRGRGAAGKVIGSLDAASLERSLIRNEVFQRRIRCC